MKKTFYILFVFMISMSGFSQTTGGFDVNSRYFNDVGRRAGSSADKAIHGSPYYNEYYSSVTIEGYDDTPLLRYNAYQDEMEFKQDGQIYYLIKRVGLKIEFTNENKVYEVVNYLDKKDHLMGYLIVLTQGANMSLYARENIKYIEERETTTGYDSHRPAEYKKINNAFFIKTGESIINFPRNRRELIRAFPDKRSQISDFLKKNRISFSKEEDLMQLVTFLNSL